MNENKKRRKRECGDCGEKALTRKRQCLSCYIANYEDWVYSVAPRGVSNCFATNKQLERNWNAGYFVREEEGQDEREA